MLKLLRTCISKKNVLVLLALAVLVACMGTSFVSVAVDALLPEKQVTITVNSPSETGGNEIWVFEDGQTSNLFQQCKNGGWDGAWEYRDAVEHGYAGNMICSYGDNGYSSISFLAPVSSTAFLMFWKNASSGTVTITADGVSQEISLYSDVVGGEMEKVFPFEDSALSVVYRLVAYALLTALFFAIFLGLFQWLSNRRSSPLGCRGIKWWYIFPLWVALYTLAVIQYKNGWIPNFMEFGDQLYYWGIPLLTDGKWDPAAAAAQMFSFRGYLCNFAPSVAQILAPVLRVDPVHIYFLFPTAALAWLTGYVLPGFYQALTHKKTTIIQFLVSLVAYLFFWNGTLTALLVDLLGATAFLSGLLFAIRFWQARKFMFALWAGFFWAVACNLRSAYQYGIFVLGGVAVFFLLVRICKTRKTAEKPFGRMLKTHAVPVLTGGGVFLFAFLLVCVPQLQINAANGHLGLLPYDFENAWLEPDGITLASLLEASANQSLSISYTGYPNGNCSDDQMLSMKSQSATPGLDTPLFEKQDFLTVPQLLRVYAQSPLESLVYIAKKLFSAFDPKTSVTYPYQIFWRQSPGLVFSFVNYAVLASGLYMLLFHRKVQKGERIIAAALFGGLVLPQMFVHVEWRYFLTSYILLYYLFAYHFIGETVTQADEFRLLAGKNYFPYLVAFIFSSFVVSLTIWA